MIVYSIYQSLSWKVTEEEKSESQMRSQNQETMKGLVVREKVYKSNMKSHAPQKYSKVCHGRDEEQ